MHPAQKISMELVTKYLMQTASPSAPATLKDIINFTGVSESSVRRIIRKHPAIVRLEVPGKEAKYYLDQNKVVEAVTPPVDNGRVPLIHVDKEFITKIENFNVVEFSKQAKRWRFDESRAALTKALNQAQDYQNGLDSIDPQVMAEARIGIDNLLQYSVLLIAYLRKVKQHPEYTSDENWWAIWPKD